VHYYHIVNVGLISWNQRHATRMQPDSHIIWYNFISYLTKNSQRVSITTDSCYFIGDMSVHCRRV
jgi:hypothetical protein